jgi:hypothetical protein
LCPDSCRNRCGAEGVRGVPLSDSCAATNPTAATQSASGCSPGLRQARSSGSRTANTSAVTPKPATFASSPPAGCARALTLPCHAHGGDHIDVSSQLAEARWSCQSADEARRFISRAIATPEDEASKHTRCSTSSENCRELWKPSQYCAIEGLTCERRQRRTGAVVERHKSRRLQLLYC